MKKPTVGIVGTGIYLPSSRMTAKEISDLTQGVWSEQAVIEKLGIREKTIPGPDDGTQEMGVKAALDCLKNSGVDPKEIDVVLNVGEEWKEYPLTTSALYVIGEIGATNAWGIDVQNRCCTTVSALKMAKDMLIADDEMNMVMVVGGYRNSDFVDFTDKNMSMMYNLGAGGGAIILKKNYHKNILLGSHIIALGTLARSVFVDYRGSNQIVSNNGIEENNGSFRINDPINLKNRLDEVSNLNFYKCIDEALRKSKMTRNDLDFLAILHIKRSAHESIIETLKLKDYQTIYLENYGHIGQIDQILSLHLGLQSKNVKEGSVVCMLAAGIGYVWAANIIKWGESQY